MNRELSKNKAQMTIKYKKITRYHCLIQIKTLRFHPILVRKEEKNTDKNGCREGKPYILLL